MTTTAVQQLADIREQWGDLLAAIETEPAADWPPRQPSVQHLQREPDLQCAGCNDTGACAGGPCALTTPTVGRLPLVLREHPAPLNLAALDAAIAIETALFDLADRIAAAIQRPVRHRRPHHPAGGTSATTYRPTHRVSRTDRDDPDRWHTATVRDLGRASAASAGSRALGLHWCAVWLEDRLAQTEPTDLHGIVRGALHIHAETVTDTCARTLARALGRDGRDTALDAPCPWCGGQLTARTTSGDPMAAVVTCGTGPTCTAPAPYDTEARRTWRDADLCGLYGALSAAERRATA